MAAGRASARLTPIPPLALSQDVGDLTLGKAFPQVAPHNIALAREQVLEAEREFCTRDETLTCLGSAERARVAAWLEARTARVASRETGTPAGAAGARLVSDGLRLERIPIVLFTSSMKGGPTAAILRYRDPRSRRWILGIALARDFVSGVESDLFLDGVLVQEMVHYHDLAYLPDPMRCYESNIEIRGQYAMMAYWRSHAVGAAALHPRVALALGARLDSSSSRAQWYRYLNRVEKTDFRVEDELVSLEYRTLPALAPAREDDERFLGELSRIAGDAVGEANYLKQNVAWLAGDAIDTRARTMSAVARLVPRVVARYEDLRARLVDADGTTRPHAMAERLMSVKLSLAYLNRMIGVLAANADFQRKSAFAGPE